MPRERPIHWLGSSLKDIQAFPAEVRKEAGYQLHRIQNGFKASDVKSFSAVGKGVEEVRLDNADGTYRVMYIARSFEAVFVLHCFRKKTQRTAKVDINIARARFRSISKIGFRAS